MKYVGEKPFTLPDDLMPLVRITATSMELSSRQTAKCQTTGPVSSRPEDLCRATWLRRKTQLKTPVCVCVCLALSVYSCFSFALVCVSYLLPVMLARALPWSCYHVGWRTSAVGHKNTTYIARDWKNNKRWTALMKAQHLHGRLMPQTHE